MNTQATKNYFLSQPHQPFFLLGIINAILMMVLFFLSYKGAITLQLDTLTFHSYSLIFTLFSNVFNGFLFTTFPRFNQTQPIEQSFYTKLFYANIFGTLLFLCGTIFSLYSVVLGMGILTLTHGYAIKQLFTIYKIGTAPDKTDSLWILIAQFFGFFGQLFFICSLYFPLLLPLAVSISFYMYAIFLAFSVGQRMIPFFSHSFAHKDPKFVLLIFTLFIFRALCSIFEFSIGTIVLDLAIGGYMLYEFKRWQLHPFQSPPILWVLHLAIFWLPTAFFLSAITTLAALFLETSFYFLTIHLLALGFLTTVLIGFGTRVILGHAKQAPHADKFAKKLFIFIQVVVLLRGMVSLNIAFGWNSNEIFDLTVLAWIILFFAWGMRYTKLLVFGGQR